MLFRFMYLICLRGQYLFSNHIMNSGVVAQSFLSRNVWFNGFKKSIPACNGLIKFVEIKKLKFSKYSTISFRLKLHPKVAYWLDWVNN